MKAIYSRTVEKSSGFLFARWSAGAKPFELSLPRNRRVLEDKLAPYYAGIAGMEMVAMMQRINPAVRQGIVLRARYMDDYSRSAIAAGCEQVVLIGAGYDSRYWRMPEFHLVDIFELDLDSTQVIKKSLTRRLFGRLPANVRYITANLAQDSVPEKLTAAGLQRDRKTLYIWEGVTLFLNDEIVAETLSCFRELTPNCRVTFDFVPPELIDDETDYQGNRQLISLCQSINEPLTFAARPLAMKQLLCGIGYQNVVIVSMREANLLYCGSAQIEDSYFFATAESGPVVESALVTRPRSGTS